MINFKSQPAPVTFDTASIRNIIAVLNFEIENYREMLQPHDTGHIHTTINFLEKRVSDLKKVIGE